MHDAQRVAIRRQPDFARLHRQIDLRQQFPATDFPDANRPVEIRNRHALPCRIDRDERRIGLSIKAAGYDEKELAAETAAFDNLGSDELTSLGDILDAATSDD